jgi:hypothetical protein
MTAWLRRNRWYLIAVAVLLPAAFLVALSLRFIPYLRTEPDPQEVPRGEVVRYAGADVQLLDLEVLDGREHGVRADADLVVATVAVEVVEPAEFALCDIDLVSVDADGERMWTAETGSAGDYRIPDRYAWSCDLTTAGDSEIQLLFLIPAGEGIEPVVQVSSNEALPRVLRLH